MLLILSCRFGPSIKMQYPRSIANNMNHGQSAPFKGIIQRLDGVAIESMGSFEHGSYVFWIMVAYSESLNCNPMFWSLHPLA